MKEKLSTIRAKVLSLKDMAGEEMDLGSNNSTVQCAYVKGGEILALLDSITEALDSQEWIDVKESLPEKSGYYLVRIKHDSSYLTYSPDNWCMVVMFKYGKFEGLDSKVTVLHWMPLPKPPAETEKKIADLEHADLGLGLEKEWLGHSIADWDTSGVIFHPKLPIKD